MSTFLKIYNALILMEKSKLNNGQIDWIFYLLLLNSYTKIDINNYIILNLLIKLVISFFIQLNYEYNSLEYNSSIE